MLFVFALHRILCLHFLKVWMMNFLILQIFLRRCGRALHRWVRIRTASALLGWSEPGDHHPIFLAGVIGYRRWCGSFWRVSMSQPSATTPTVSAWTKAAIQHSSIYRNILRWQSGLLRAIKGLFWLCHGSQKWGAKWTAHLRLNEPFQHLFAIPLYTRIRIT